MLLLLAVNGTITGGLSAVSNSAMHSRHGLAQRQADALHFVEAGLRVFLMHSARERTAEWHPRDETYQAALACLVDAIHAHPFTALWGDGETSSSDGQFFRAGGHGEARADHNAHYGSECQSGNYLRVTEGYLRMKAMETRLRARRTPFGLPAEGALGSGQEPTSEQRCTFTTSSCKTPLHLDLWVTRNTGVVTNAAYPFDSPKKVVAGEVLNRIDGLSHSKIITDPRFSFANSALLFAFNSRLPAQIRK